MANSLRERRRQLLREEILQVAQQLLDEKGYNAMLMDEVAARAGISKPTLYSHFPTKYDLLVAAINQKLAEVVVLLEADPGGVSPLRQLLYLLRVFVQRQIDEAAPMMQPNPELFQMLCTDAAVVANLRRIDTLVIAIVQAGVVAGEINPALDQAMVVRTFYALVNSPRMVLLGMGGSPNPAIMADTVVSIFERGVQPVAG